MGLEAAEFLSGKDTISTKEATVTMTFNGQVYKMLECKKFSAKLEKNKEDIQTLGTHWKRKKTTSIEGTGTIGAYIINSNFIKMALPYIQNGKDAYFDITFTIEDETTAWGKQVIQLHNVNFDDIPIADFEADDGVMDEETDFTFEGFDLIQGFDSTTF
ncbi:phage tail tube protein [Lactobacillus sp. ESL0679]|uniref:phage tail tube protein n=1 Tax=Lactobacillus sp. ESL0679 TaxID=2983209 RepID=UPI0023F96E38|nr:phage tail tube protein [Lactobacillus sp. ESL0679]MDF7683636.1 phage tail tube protein [Lactobacillus sp. ESL0679]